MTDEELGFGLFNKWKDEAYAAGLEYTGRCDLECAHVGAMVRLLREVFAYGAIPSTAWLDEARKLVGEKEMDHD